MNSQNSDRVVISANDINILTNRNKRSKSVGTRISISKPKKYKPFQLSEQSKSFMDKFSAKRIESKINSNINEIYHKILNQYNGQNKLKDLYEYLEYFGYDQIMGKSKIEKYIEKTVKFELEQARATFTTMLEMLNDIIKSNFMKHTEMHLLFIIDVIKYLINDYDEKTHVVKVVQKQYHNSEARTCVGYIPKFKIYNWNDPKREEIEEYVNEKLVNEILKRNTYTYDLTSIVEIVAESIIHDIFHTELSPVSYPNPKIYGWKYSSFGTRNHEGLWHTTWHNDKDSHVIEQIVAYLIYVRSIRASQNKSQISTNNE